MSIVSRLPLAILALGLTCCLARSATPAVDARKEEQTIRELDTRWSLAVSSHDAEIALALYAPNVIVLDPGAPAKRGIDAMRASWNDLVKMPGAAIAITPEKIEISAAGDLATDFGRFDLEMDGPNGRVKMVNKYLTIWRKLKGQWKVAYDSWNTNVPPSK